ncbi:MAG: hypothetical protein IIY33_04305, partial [Erysipelotrichaceae bacterium]|nr:hypothetical protein [Erysipelotrichaceae bacterium]
KKSIIFIVIALILALFAIVFFTKIYPELQYNKAVGKYESGSYKEAYTAFLEVHGYKDAGNYIDKIYDVAVEYVNAGNYEAATELFTAFGDYKDSVNYVNQEIPYLKAIDLFNQGDLDGSEELFNTLTDYKNTAEFINQAIPYQRAVQLFEKGNIDGAIEGFSSLGDYESTKDYIEKIKAMSIKSAKEGSYIYFGEYEQDGDQSNGAEPIKWYVLEYSDNSILALSEYGLDCLSYFRTDIIGWLRDNFYNAAFNSSEIKQVPKDKIRLLYSNELKKDFIVCTPTQYALDKGVETYRWKVCYWWLSGNAKFIGKNEEIRSYIVSTSYRLGVRPVIQINLSK